MKNLRLFVLCSALAWVSATCPSFADTSTTNNIEESFTGTTTQNNWETYDACLTASSTAVSTTNNDPWYASGSVPLCNSSTDPFGTAQLGGVSGSLPDPIGQGALRLTNDGNNEHGAILSLTPFDSSNGVNVTFITVTYEGDSGGAGSDGADGMGFYLLDGSKFKVSTQNTLLNGTPLLVYNPDTTNVPQINNQYQVAHVGAYGGSLGYSCANGKGYPGGNGIVGGYMGLGIDEYGNYMNPGDNSASGPGYSPGEIGIRGIGDVSWEWLLANYNSELNQYTPANDNNSSSDIGNIIQSTCATGTLSYTGQDNNGNNINIPITDGNGNNINIPDYTYLPNSYISLPFTIANESATQRSQATPIIYKLQITAQGKLTFAYAYNGGAFTTVLNNQDITASNGALPSSLYFGFGGSTGGSRNIHEITCFKAVPSDTASSSATANTQQSGAIQTNTQVYLAYYHPNNWWGSLQSYNLTTTVNGGITTVALNNSPNWDATCGLTGASNLPSGVCPTGSSATPIAPASRVILTWLPSTTAQTPYNVYGVGKPFEWSSSDLNSSQQTALGSQNILKYLRGDRSNELNTAGTSGTYRARTSVLGDIQDSSPQWVGSPGSPYNITWKDLLNTSTTMSENSASYSSFMSTNATREDIIYVGANDGLLHGFRSGYYDSTGTYQSSTNDGQEVLAYMPQSVLNTINKNSSNNNALKYPNQAYAHQWFVDATPGVGDLYYKGAWHTWLVAGLGSGGPDLYALDITNPSNFLESTPTKVVIGDWTASTITCVNDSSCGKKLGNIMGDPQVRRLHDGNWGVIFGNGLKSANGQAGIFIMEVDSSTGAITFRYLDTGIASGSGDGIAYAAAADLDGDHITDYVYAGDLLGNVWRFDLTSSNPANWKTSSFTSSSTPSPLFKTATSQPITTRPVLASVPTSGAGQPRFLIEFGTGQVVGQTWNAPASYTAAQQALYGVWDWNMANWNSLSTTLYASIATPPGTIAANTTNLTSQTITNSTLAGSGSVLGFRTVTSNTVCWKGSTVCTSGNSKYGWMDNFPSTGTSGIYEEVIYNPLLSFGQLVVNTSIPPTNSIYDCNSVLPSGYTMAISPTNGGATLHSSFSPTVNGSFVTTSILSGAKLNATGTPFVLTLNGGAYLVNQTVSGTGVVLPLNPAANAGVGKRLNWMQLR